MYAVLYQRQLSEFVDISVFIAGGGFVLVKRMTRQKMIKDGALAVSANFTTAL